MEEDILTKFTFDFWKILLLRLLGNHYYIICYLGIGKYTKQNTVWPIWKQDTPIKYSNIFKKINNSY